MQVMCVVSLVAVFSITVQVSVSTTDVKITGGSEAKRNEYPFVVYLVDEDGRHKCTGSLVDRRWVLTAAHCMGHASNVVLGDYSRPENDTTEQVIAIEEELQHPGYQDKRVIHDIGLIKLARPADIRSEAVAKIAPLTSKPYNKKMMANQKNCRLVGWGITKTSDGINGATNKLLKLRMRVVNETEDAMRNANVYWDEGMIAIEAIYKDASCRIGGSCSGDSGAPFVCRKNGKWVQTGVHSFGLPLDGCMHGIKGEVNVYEHITWIQSIIDSQLIPP